MAIQASIVEILDGTNNAGALMFQVKEILVNNAGWTVAGSSDGTTGGMDGIDRIVDRDSIENTNDWVVLESPHANAADRIQILFTKTSTGDEQGAFKYNPQADWASASTALPTSAYESAHTFTSNISPSSDFRFHMLVDNAEPYGFALQCAQISNQLPSLFMALVPLDARAPTAPGKPYVFITETNALYTTLSTEDDSKVAEPENPPQVPQRATPCGVFNNQGRKAPGGLPQTSSGRDQSSPVIFHHPSEYFGVSTFMLWNGTPRNNLDTLEDDVLGLRGRIVFGDVNFPWDGSTVPDSSTVL